MKLEALETDLEAGRRRQHSWAVNSGRSVREETSRGGGTGRNSQEKRDIRRRR
jgi:hypothetical protein